MGTATCANVGPAGTPRAGVWREKRRRLRHSFGSGYRRCGDETTSPSTTSDVGQVSVARQLPAAAEIDPDLAGIIIAWPDLPPHIKAAVLTLVAAVPHP